MKKIRPLRGYVMLRPNGTMSRLVAGNREWCKTEAAMDRNGKGMCTMPADWIGAQKAGYRIIRVVVCPLETR